MLSRPAVVTFIVIVAEFAATAKAIDALGFLPTLGLLALFSIGGMAIVRWKAAGLLMSTLEAATSPTGATGAVADRLLGVFAGLLLALPGFVTSAVGLLLLVPPVRRVIEPLVVARTARWSLPITNRPGTRAGRVVDDQIIDVDVVDNGPGAPRSARPEVG